MKPLHSKAKLLEIAMWLVQTLKQGEIRLQTNGTENIQLQIENTKMALNFFQRELIRDVLELEAEMEKESVLERLETLGSFAEKLKENGFTMTISHKGQKILTLGAEANPTISQAVTGTNAIEIDNLIELIRLVK